LHNDRVRLALLTVVMVLLAAYAIGAGTGPFGVGNGSATDQAGTGCPAETAPALATVSLTRLLALRARLDRTMAGFEPGLRPYEEGLVPATSVWTDAEPVAGGSRPPSGPWPAGYEMRWWLESGDDLVADVFVFTDSRRARDFSVLAQRPRCGSSTRAVYVAPGPGTAHNLQWRNPLGFMQQDAYLQRGRRVYWVSVVRPGSEAVPSARGRQKAFALVDDMACRLSSCR
jgi:hypothetical protein